MDSRGQRDSIFQTAERGKKSQLGILYIAKLSFKNEGKIMTLLDKQKLREFVVIRPTLQEIVWNVLQAKYE